MPLSPAPHESPAKGGDNEPSPDSISPFQTLTGKLFRVDLVEFRELEARDKAERAARRKAKGAARKTAPDVTNSAGEGPGVAVEK